MKRLLFCLLLVSGLASTLSAGPGLKDLSLIGVSNELTSGIFTVKSGASFIFAAGSTVTFGNPLSMANGGLGVALTDPNADRLLFWDDSAGAYAYLSLGTNLSITGTTINVSGGGDALVANPLSQFAPTTSAQLRGVLSDEVGTGAAYFVGGALGTPASGNMSNATAIPAGQIVGVIPIANLATGTPTGSKFIRDDGALATPSGAGSVTNNGGDLTANAVMLGAGTTDSKVIASLGTSGQVLTSAGAGSPPSWQNSAASSNYFGDGSDGSVTISADTTLASDTGVNDTGVVVKNYTSLTINSSVSLTATSRSKAMVIYVTGNLTVNGALHMDARGAAAAAEEIVVSRATPTETFPTLSKALITWRIPAAGAAGAAAVTTGSPVASGTNGSAGVGLQTGGGGSGAGGVGGASALGNGGAGAAGTSFVGGSGGGAGGYAGSAGTPGQAGAINGGAGGFAAANSATIGDSAAGGGAGNPAGAGQFGTGGSVSNAPGGGGGTLIVIVGGDITVGASGRISADGSRGGNATSPTNRATGGGGAGGGIVLLRYAGSYTNGGTVRASGGAGGTASGTLSSNNGGNGGDGSVSVAAVNP